MFVAEWTPERGWYDARITPYGPFSLDPATAVLHYAQEVFEGDLGAVQRGGLGADSAGVVAGPRNAQPVYRGHRASIHE